MDAQPMNQDESHKKTLWIALAALVVIVAVAAFFLSRGGNEMADDVMEKDDAMMEGTTEKAMDEGPQTGKMGLSIKGGNADVSVDDEVTLFVYADSYESEVTAYDLVIHYDPTLLVMNEVVPLIEGLDIYETQEELENGDMELIVTGVKSLSQTDSFMFANTALAEVSFTPIAAGTAEVNVAYERGSNRDSNLFDGTTQDILTSVEGVTLMIK